MSSELPVDWRICIACAERRCSASVSDLEGNDVIGPWPEAVRVQTPDLVQDLRELLVGPLTVRTNTKGLGFELPCLLDLINGR